MPASLLRGNNELVAPRDEAKEPDLKTIRGRLEWACREKGETKTTLAEATGLDPSRFSRDMVRPSARTVAAVSPVLGLSQDWWLDGKGQPWLPGREPRNERKKDRRTKEGREGPATDTQAALAEYPFTGRYSGARALAAADLVKFHGWRPGRVVIDIIDNQLQFHEPPGKSEREIADGIVATMRRIKDEEEGRARVVSAPARDLALPAARRPADAPPRGKRRQ